MPGREGAGGLDHEGAGIAVEGDGVGVMEVGLVVGGTDFRFERVSYGSPYFFYYSFFFVMIRAVLDTGGSVPDPRGGALGATATGRSFSSSRPLAASPSRSPGSS